MLLTFGGKTLIATYKEYSHSIPADCVVRNEENGRRKLHDPKEVIRAMTYDPYNKPPVMPRTFPPGKWHVYRPRPHTDEYLAPYFIPTEAEQYLATWDLDENGGYSKPNGGKVLDIGYGLHFSTSLTTVGCIRIYRREDLIWLKNVIEEMYDAREPIWLEVM